MRSETLIGLGLSVLAMLVAFLLGIPIFKATGSYPSWERWLLATSVSGAILFLFAAIPLRLWRKGGLTLGDRITILLLCGGGCLFLEGLAWGIVVLRS